VHFLVDETLHLGIVAHGLIELHHLDILHSLCIHLFSKILYEFCGWLQLNVFQAVEDVAENLFDGLVLGILVFQILICSVERIGIGHYLEGEAEFEVQAGHDGYATQNSKNWSLSGHTSFIDLIVEMVTVLVISIINRIKRRIPIESFGPLTTLP